MMGVWAYSALLLILSASAEARTANSTNSTGTGESHPHNAATRNTTDHTGFTITPSDKVINVNSSAYFHCRAPGNPTIIWEKVGRDQLMTLGQRFRCIMWSCDISVDGNGTLHFRHASFQASGRYNCIAVYPNYAIHTSFNLEVIDFRTPAAPPSNIRVLRIPGGYILATWSPPPMNYGRVNITGYTVFLRSSNIRYGRRYDSVREFAVSGESIAMLDKDVRSNYSVLVAAKSPYGHGPPSRPIKPKTILMRTGIFETSGWNKTGPKVTIIKQTYAFAKVNVTWPTIPHFYHAKTISYDLQMHGSDRKFYQTTTSSEWAIVGDLRVGNTYKFRVRPKNQRLLYGPWTAQATINISS